MSGVLSVLVPCVICFDYWCVRCLRVEFAKDPLARR